MIYLFCNYKYGRHFIKVAQIYSIKENTPLTLVLSEKSSALQESRGKLMVKLLQFLRKIYFIIKFSCVCKIPYLIVKEVNSSSFYEKIKPNDFGIIAGFNQIFKKEPIRRFSHLVNFHPSVLPYYRGPVPSYWCIKNGESYTGYTLHKVTENIDKGEIFYQEIVPIDRIDRPDILDTKIAKKASLKLIEYLDHIQKGTTMETVKLDADKIYKTHTDYCP